MAEAVAKTSAAEEQAPSGTASRRAVLTLLFSVFVVSMCGIFYELLLGSVASYIIGNSITQFSITIGLFMFFMGVGSYLSKFIETRLLDRFVAIEIAIGAAGGLAVLLLLTSFSFTRTFYPVAVALIAAISTLIGLEIPLVTRLVRIEIRGGEDLRESLAHVLALDYVGALIASLLFPLLLLPAFGLMMTGFLVGALNLVVALFAIRIFWPRLAGPGGLQAAAASILFLLIAGIAATGPINRVIEGFLYEDEVIYSTQTQYQRLVLTKFKDDLRLYINGDLQFSSRDEYRYHEPLVHVPLGLSPHHKNVLVLGGGDGLAARELLKYPDLESITLVDLDPQMLKLAMSHPLVRRLNQDSLADKRVERVFLDAFNYVENCNRSFDAIIIDLPDPNDLSLGKLYSVEFYRLVLRLLSADGIIVTQATSPYFARQAFWMIKHTMEQAAPFSSAYSVSVPSFGQWGFVLGAHHRIDPSRLKIAVSTRFLNPENAADAFRFDPDVAEIPTDINRLDNQLLVQSYDRGWKEWN